MSIPGLGQIPVQAATSTSRTVALSPASEWRFDIPPGAAVTVKLLSGTAEKDGVELAPRTAYTLAGQKSKLLSWHGCELEVSGRTASEGVRAYARAVDNPATAVVNLHAYLSEMRAAATASPSASTTTTTTSAATTSAAAAATVSLSATSRPGPRVLVAGAPGTGKTTLARTLVSYATRQGAHVVAVNADPAEGMLSLAGTLSAAVYATPADAESRDGWGATPTSGASAAPVKTPVVYALGRLRGTDDPATYRQLVGRLAGAVSGRLSEDAAVRGAGVVVDSMGVEAEEEEEEGSKAGVELLAHIVDELSINVVVVLGSPKLHSVLARRFASERTSLGEVIQVVPLDSSDGVVERDETYMRYFREATIKEYFFGDARRTLSPQIQQVDFDSVLIYKVSDDGGLVREEPSSTMQHWTLAVMHAALREPPEQVRVANVMGFVYVADVDEERRKVKILAPVGGRLGDKPMIWGRWPEPYINLLG